MIAAVHACQWWRINTANFKSMAHLFTANATHDTDGSLGKLY
ncbi:hypothetical protein [Pleurocapsa sp. PCC 7319]|nr:hypothetical protein [Pleurocapsa sp. PCC 7319]